MIAISYFLPGENANKHSAELSSFVFNEEIAPFTICPLLVGKNLSLFLL
jgi:hypothetical protein